MSIHPSILPRLLAAATVLAFATAGCAVSSPSASPAAATVAPPTSTPAAPTAPAPTTTPVAGPVACQAADLTAAIISWEGGAGHRMAHVELANAGQAACTIHALAVPQLVGGDGTVLMTGPPAAASAVLTFPPGATLKSVVDDANYCGTAPKAPVTLAFVVPSEGRVVASPVSPTDTDGVPPCMGAGSGGAIQMQPWAP